jgi:hypothetical protein
MSYLLLLSSCPVSKKSVQMYSFGTTLWIAIVQFPLRTCTFCLFRWFIVSELILDRVNQSDLLHIGWKTLPGKTQHCSVKPHSAEYRAIIDNKTQLTKIGLFMGMITGDNWASVSYTHLSTWPWPPPTMYTVSQVIHFVKAKGNITC